MRLRDSSGLHVHSIRTLRLLSSRKLVLHGGGRRQSGRTGAVGITHRGDAPAVDTCNHRLGGRWLRRCACPQDFQRGAERLHGIHRARVEPEHDMIDTGVLVGTQQRCSLVRL